MWVSAAQGSGSPLLGFSRQTSNGTSYGAISAAGGSPMSVPTKQQPAEGFFDANLNSAGTQLVYVYQYYDQSISQFRHVYSIANVGGSSIASYASGFGVQDANFADASGSSVVWSGFVHDAFSPSPDACVQNQVGLGISTPLAGGGYDTTKPTYTICPSGDDAIQPMVSPDGTKVATTLVPTGTSTPGTIAVFPKADNPSGALLTPSGVNAFDPAWSADGSSIAFAETNNTIWTVPAGGGTLTQILTDATRPAWSPYTLPGSGGGTGDELSKLTLASRTVHSGKTLTFDVTLKASAKITIEILRHVPASGSGKHRKKAHYVLVGTLTFSGKVGLNKLPVSKLHGHKLSKASYEAEVFAGGKAHAVAFKVN